MKTAKEDLQNMISKGERIPMLMMSGINGYVWFCGGRCVFDSDGSGWLASQNIIWDRLGNIIFNGTVTSNNAGDRVIIDPSTRSLKMIDASENVVYIQDFFVNGNYSGGRLRINLVDHNTGQNSCYAEIDGGKIALYTSDKQEFIRADAYQKKIWIDADLLPQNRDAAYHKEMYMDGEAVKVKRE